jgi:hypothetical protein
LDSYISVSAKEYTREFIESPPIDDDMWFYATKVTLDDKTRFKLCASDGNESVLEYQ